MKTKETITQTLQPYVERLLKGLEKGVDYAQQEIPEILEQYVLFEAVKSWFLVAFSITLIAVFSIYCIRKWKDKESWFYPESSYDDHPGYLFTIIGGFLTVCISCQVFFSNIFTAVKATFMTKLFLVERFIELI